VSVRGKRKNRARGREFADEGLAVERHFVLVALEVFPDTDVLDLLWTKHVQNSRLVQRTQEFVETAVLALEPLPVDPAVHQTAVGSFRRRKDRTG
jgi:hypothetical protein